MSLVEFRRYYDRFEAEIVKGRLASEGVECVLFDGGLADVYGAALPVRLMMLDEDVATSHAILATDDDGRTGGTT